MAGYVKIWTTLRNNVPFLSLNGNARGMYLQIILAAKNQRDDGTVCYRNVATLGSDCGYDRRTASKLITILEQKCLIKSEKSDTGVITITLPNYKYWQEITADEVRQRPRKNVTKMLPSRPIPYQTIPDHTRPIAAACPPQKSKEKRETDPDHAQAVKYFCDLYFDKYGIKYNFVSGKDGKLIQGLLTTYGIDFFRHLVDQLYVTSDEFIINKGKISIGVLHACANKLTHEIVNRQDLRSMFSEKERQAIKNIAEGLGITYEPTTRIR